MGDEKRKRCPNWLMIEKDLLLNIIEGHLNVIEHKKFDTNTMRRKAAEWAIIAQKFNSQTTHIGRTAENLKGLWESLKKNARKEDAKNGMSRQTGGSDSDSKKDDTVHTRILAFLDTIATRQSNSLDSDTLTNTPPDNVSIEQQISCDEDSITFEEKPEETLSPENADNSTMNEDWDDPLRLVNERKAFTCAKRKPWNLKRYQNSSSSSLERLREKKLMILEIQEKKAAEDRGHETAKRSISLEIENERLKQEKIKTKLLLLELKLIRKKYNLL